MANPDILNSKIKKLRIELPHYSFSHSSSEESPNFIGRKQIIEKLKTLIEATADKTGVYLIAGNRGVGKTRLVNQVIKQTSLEPNSNFSQNLRYVFTLFFSIVITQYCLQEFDFPEKYQIIFLLFVSSFVWLCFHNGYRSKFSEQTNWKRSLKIKDGICSALKELSSLKKPYNPYKEMQYLLKIILIVSFSQIISIITGITPIIVFFGYSAFPFFIFIRNKWHKYKQKIKKEKSSKNTTLSILEHLFLIPVQNYLKNHSRLYLRINFGHKLKDEKDILRLIVRTLATEYHKYHCSFRRLFFWRFIAFGILFLLASTFSSIVETNAFYYELKNNSTLLAFDELVFEISKKTTKIPQYIFCKNMSEVNEWTVYKFIFPINYLFWLSFFLMYLFCVLLFRSNWFTTQFFVTHRMIEKQLKRLNLDITHSTERGNSINVQNKSIGIGARIKRTRGIADAREIEKELQDILNNVQRIPIFMCRPNIVIVFDELDKVEPDDNNSEKEIPRTKASLFSIDTAREKQTEILKILSNMKYFLSTSNSKFIFIAGREMYDIHLADVSDRNNYIGSIFNAVIYVPSFLTDYSKDAHGDMTSLTEEFVCCRLIPRDCFNFGVPYNLTGYRIYLEKYIYNIGTEKIEQKIHKIIAVLQQFIIYLAHVSKGAPKKMMQIFESFVEVCEIDKIEEDKFLVVQRYHNSQLFLTFNYYKQHALGIIAYLITPIFNRLSERNIKEHSDKLLVSSLRFVDFLFKFHKHPFSWKHLDISPEMLEVNRAPELKAIAVDLLNYLTQIHLNKPNFSLSDYKFDSLIANEISTITKTDEVFSALFSFSLDETLPLKKHYQDLLETTQKKYLNDKNSTEFVDAISSLQVVLGDLHYYDDELEEAGVYYENAIQALRYLEPKNDDKEKKDGKSMTLEQLYLYVRNMLRLGMIYEKRKQYDFAYLTYDELCKRIMITKSRPLSFKETSPNINDMLFKEMTFEGLKMLYLPFIAKLQILEKSHIGGITLNHLEQLEKEFKFIIFAINCEEAKFLKLLEAEFYSRLADILYYKNSDLKCKKSKLSGRDNKIDKENYSCTACDYYCKALSVLLGLDKQKNTVIKLLSESVKRINENYNVKYCTVLARILSDWGNVFFSCDNTEKNNKNKKYCICNAKDFCCMKPQKLRTVLKKYIEYIESESNGKNRGSILDKFRKPETEFSKIEIAFAMYAISLKAYIKANLYKRSAYQIFKMLRLFKYYKIYDYVEKLSQKAIRSLWHATECLNVFELNKRKKDFDKKTIEDKIPLKYLLVDSEINRILILTKELELKSNKTSEKLRECYDMCITSPYGIKYSILVRIYRLWFKSIVNYKTYKKLIDESKKILPEIKSILEKEHCNEEHCNENIKIIFVEYLNKSGKDVNEETKAEILEELITESIFCFKEIIRLSKTVGETYLFNHSFMGSMHTKLSFWIRRYEVYRINFCSGYKDLPRIDELLKYFLGEDWKEQLSGHYETQQALSHYYKCLETHNEGRAYHNMIDNMCYIKDDYNDRSDHFSIAEERHNILNGKIKEKIKKIKYFYENSGLYKADNYFEKAIYKKE